MLHTPNPIWSPATYSTYIRSVVGGWRGSFIVHLCVTFGNAHTVFSYSVCIRKIPTLPCGSSVRVVENPSVRDKFRVSLVPRFESNVIFAGVGKMTWCLDFNGYSLLNAPPLKVNARALVEHGVKTHMSRCSQGKVELAVVSVVQDIV